MRMRKNNNLNNTKTMKEKIMPGIVLILIGAVAALIILAGFQFNRRLNKIEDASVQTANTVTSIVSFLNQATGQTQQPAAEGEQAAQ